MRFNRFPVLILALFAFCLQALSAQDPTGARSEELRRKRLQKAESLEPEEVEGFQRWLRDYEQRPLHAKLMQKGYGGFRLLIGGMPAGAGLVFGAGYVNGFNRDSVRFSLDTRYSTRGYEQVDGLVEFPNPQGGRAVNAFVRLGYRDYKEINFFGVGNQTNKRDEASFRMEDRRILGGVLIRPSDRLRIGAELGYVDTHIGTGDDEDPLQTVFDPATIPGLLGSPDYFSYGGFVQYQYEDSGFPPAGFGFRIGVGRFEDREVDPSAFSGFGFTRLTGEFQIRIPLGQRNRRLAFQARTSHSLPDAGEEVPFYHMETLGGTNSIPIVSELSLDTPLRGFVDNRFRDRRSLLLNLEYRWEVWNYADFVLFTDAGKVFRRAGDLDFSDLHAGYGFGLLVRLPRVARFRIDVARSYEGFHLHVGAGPRF